MTRRSRRDALNVKAFGRGSAPTERPIVAPGVSVASNVRTPGTRCSARRGGGGAGAGTRFVVERVNRRWCAEGGSAGGCAATVVAVVVVVVVVVAFVRCRARVVVGK